MKAKEIGHLVRDGALEGVEVGRELPAPAGVGQGLQMLNNNDNNNNNDDNTIDQ